MGSDVDNPDQRLSRIETLWPVLEQAHRGTDSAAVAQWELMKRYRGAVYRYLMGAVRDPDAAEELFQEFALRFLRGDLRRADPRRGRFRDYLKTVLINLVNDYHRDRKAKAVTLPPDLAAPAASPEGNGPEGEGVGGEEARFIGSWSKELMDQVWPELQKAYPASYAVLRFHVQNPGVPSSEAAARLSAELGRAMTQANARVMLCRARERFAQLLIKEVGRSLGSPTEDALLQELRDLRLLAHCKPALDRRKR